MRILLISCLLALLTACQSMPSRTLDAAPPRAAGTSTWEGQYDNHQQVWRQRQGGQAALPQARFDVAATGGPDWYVMDVDLNMPPAQQARWLLHRQVNGEQVRITPYHPLRADADPEAGNDSSQWAPLLPCAMRGTRSASGLGVQADIAACATIAPGIGAAAALLPIGLEKEGDWLRVRLYSDQARGSDARHEARRVEAFTGWAVINGGGPQASADNNDWHMNESLILGSEGGRQPLLWRDGQPSGYELLLERVVYQDGELPILKLSLRDARSDSTIAYAWADEDAQRIGLNLGWLQVGLGR